MGPILSSLLISLVATAAAFGAVPRKVEGLVFLTRSGCANTLKMRANLDRALEELHWRANYRIVDLQALASDDPRRGYPTPTLLFRNKDIFGLPLPTPPYPEPA